MLVTVILAALVLLSFLLLIWQFVAAWRFPLHRRSADDSFAPAVTLLKPLKGCDEHTADALRSWLTQKYRGPLQVLFGVAEEEDPVCYVVRKLIEEFPHLDAELIITREALGTNAKVSTLVQLFYHAKHDLISVSDADVHVPDDFLAQAVAPLREESIGLVNSFYALVNPSTLAMRLEAIAVNADFWSQVLQSNTLKPQNFALGAAMITRREQIEKIGGFEALLDFLADDYQLGHRISKTGARIKLSPVVVECRDKPMNFRAVWNHQLRWARTIRVSQPGPYFFSILSNVTLWVTLLVLCGELGRFPPDSVVNDDQAPDWIAAMSLWQVPYTILIAGAVLALRCVFAALLQIRLTRRRDILGYWWLVPLKDFLQIGIWAASFLGNTVDWRGKTYRLTREGKLVPK